MFAAWWIGEPDPREWRAPDERGHGGPMISTARDTATVELTAVEPSRTERVAVDLPQKFEMPALVRSHERLSQFTRPGTLVVRAVDAETGAAIRSPSVRAASATRYAERAAGSAIDSSRLRVSPGEYALSVGSPGYEPTWIPTVRVEFKRTTELDPVRLRPGTARIVGRISGDLGDDLSVDLHGTGRPHCSSCRVHTCPRCGRGDDRTRIALAPTGEFAFERLASGVYVVRLVDGKGREAGTPLRVHLSVGETREIVVPVVRPRTVVVALEDVDGAPLDALWSLRLARPIERRVAPVTVRALRWNARFLDGEVLVAEGGFDPPDPTGAAHRLWSAGNVCTARGRLSRDDRPRTTDDTLLPPLTTPWIDPAWIGGGLGDDGRAYFDGVPARVRAIELRCGPFHASVDPGASARRVRIERDANAAEEASTFVAFETDYYD